MPVLRNIGALAACRLEGGQGAIHLQRKAALAWEGETIRWVGPEAELPAEHAKGEPIDAGGRLVVPGLIDCHTHLAFAGWRAEEFEARILARSYQDIAAAGGGIAATVARTRAATTEELIDRCAGWLADIARLGVTTVEAKSGYGLTLEDELRLLIVYRELQHRQPVRIVPTLLAAHAVPPEYRSDRQAYLRLVMEAIVPRAARDGLARFCDVFVDEGAFSVDEARAVLGRARAHGLRAKLHADQFSDAGAAALAAELGAASADHLERVSAEGIRRLARSRTVAVSLPCAALYLNDRPLPARALIDAGVPLAVATDFNPGTAPTFHMPLALLLACVLQRMTPAEALKGATIYAALAIGEDRAAGSLEPGKRADFAVIDADDVVGWISQFAANRCVATYIAGRRVGADAGLRSGMP